MSLRIDNRMIERVLIIDDDVRVREGYEDTLSDCDVESQSEKGPINSLSEYVTEMVGNGTQAAICDYQLKKAAYSVVDGAELIAAFTKANFPAILCTRWAGATPDEIRKYRQHIPVLMSPDELEPDSIANGLYRCVRELQGDLVPSRKPWRTLIRIEDLDETGPTSRVFVVIPAWNSNHVMSVSMDLISTEVKTQISRGTERVYAQCNIGAENEIDLYFDGWELP